MKRDAWPSALMATVARHRAQPFQWGQFDCATLVWDCIAAQTGRDIAGRLRGSYFSPLSALRVLRASGFATMLEHIAAHLEEIPRSQAQRGDLLFMAPATHPLASPAVVLGEVAASRSESEFLLVDLARGSRAFKVR